MSFDLMHACINWCDSHKIAYCYKDSTISTQLLAKEDEQNQTSFATNNNGVKLEKLYFTGSQSSGRGRGQNSWKNCDNPNKQFLSTWKFKTHQPINPTFSCRVGLSLYKSFKKIWPEGSFSMKAPNDIFIEDKKVAGVLIESTTLNNENILYIGIGINVLDHPALLTASSLYHSDLFVDSQSWFLFLSKLHSALVAEIHLIENTLTPVDCIELAEALNLFPMQKDKILSVDKEANIFTEKEMVSWLDL